MLESAQIRAARALLGWHQEELARQRLERAPPGPVMAHVATVVKITECLKKFGIMFIASDDAGGTGVRLKRISIE